MNSLQIFRITSVIYSAALCAALLLFVPQTQAEDSVEQQQAELNKLSKQIQQQQTALSQGQVKKNKQLKALRQAEKAISKSAKSLRVSANELSQAQQDLDRLQQQQGDLEQTRNQQQQALAQQLRSAWMSGNNDSTAVLLSNNDPAQLDRILIYYQYLNQARIDAIDEIAVTERKLEKLAIEQQRVRDKQQALHQQRQRQQQQLEQEIASQQQAVKHLNQQLKKHQQKLQRLQEDRDVLTAAIDQALQLLNNTREYHGLKKGAQPWPMRAQVRKSFGSHRQGQLSWNGWLFGAPAGQEVKAISDGQIIFADWLRGFGLVVVVDHGEEYLSLYGHAQALLKQVGEPIKRGEPLALSGNSGGIDKPGIYFEIRHRGRAVDPKQYLKRS